MSIIPETYLPPEEHLPEKIYPLPEVRLPWKLNLTDYCIDRYVRLGKGENILIYYQDQEITYLEMQKRINKLANALRELGIEKNDRVLLRSANCPEIYAAYFACWRLGAIPVLVHHLLRGDEIVFRANDSEAKAMIVSSETFPDVEKGVDRFETVKDIIVFGERIGKFHCYEDLISNQPEDIVGEETYKDDWMRIIYSSGTTGKPKGILNTIGDYVALSEVHCPYILDLKPDDVIGGHPVFAFAFGFSFLIFTGFGGCSLSMMERFSPELMFETIQDHKISVLFCVPTVFRMMLNIKNAEKKYDLSSLRLCQSAGEWLPGDTAREWKRRFGMPLLDSVGSGDLHYWLSTRVDTPNGKMDSSGIPLPGVECKIVDEKFCDVSRATEGELFVRAPWGQQYWRRPDKQKEGVEKGWNRPGLIYVEDEDGYFWYKGRNDEMIVSGGYKIPGGEVEAALLNHPAVLEAAVVSAPDPIRGNIVKAFAVLKPDFMGSDDLAQEMKDYVKKQIEPYKYPREIEFMDAAKLPRTITGKIQRFALRDMEVKKAKQENGSK